MLCKNESIGVMESLICKLGLWFGLELYNEVFLISI